LNYQIEHHLFPNICHVHYPQIAPIVRETAEEFGVPYMVNDTFGDAIKSHLNLLHQYGRLPSMDEAIV
jgi:linoleoyl-CoA desaturase